MILSHISSRHLLASIFHDGLDTGAVPLPSGVIMTGCPWFVRGEPALDAIDDTVMVIAVDFGKTLSKRLVRWLPDDKYLRTPGETYYHRGPVAPARFASVRTAGGRLLTPHDTIGEPIIREAPRYPEGARLVDWRGQTIVKDETSQSEPGGLRHSPLAMFG